MATTAPSFSFQDRNRWIEQMSKQEFDLVIIGGGITGAGVARDAATRGMKVALVEARDFAEGTSSRSSKLIHGGIRYLENLEFHLVFEALSERRLLFELAPHLVHPLRFVLPLFKGGRVPMWKMSAGMWLYDALSMFEAPEPHERLSAQETVERLPLLKNKDLLGSFVYSDAYMDDDRLTIETMRSAISNGALAVNHVAATGAKLTDGKVTAIECKDQFSNKAFTIKAKHVISTVGPWTDKVATQLLGSWKKVLRPSKGVHLTFDRSRIPLTQAVVMAEGKRIVFGIPRHEMIIIGTTDTDYKDDPENVKATEEDVRYLLKVAGEYFPGANLTADDIISTYAGVRPLVDDGAATESKTSREHMIYADPRNVTFVAGGKYTTYRRMAEQTVEFALQNFSLEEQVRFRINNTQAPLNPLATPDRFNEAQQRVKDWAYQFSWNAEAVKVLVDRHGGEATEILSLMSSPQGDDVQRLWSAEARHAVRHTMCMGLVDFYVRRSPLFLSYRDHGLRLVMPLAKVLQEELGWSDSERQVQERAVYDHVQSELGWKQAFGITPASF